MPKAEPEKSLLKVDKKVDSGQATPLLARPTAPEERPSPATPVPSPPVPEVYPEPAAPAVGAQALSEAFTRAGIGFPIDRLRFVALAKGHLVEYRPGEKVPLDEIFSQCQASVIHEADAQAFAVSIMLRGQVHGRPMPPIFSTAHRRTS